jgi:transcription elongation factor Elf1
MGPQQYGADGHVFECAMCGHDQFKVGAYIALLGMHTLVCSQCSHVEFFEKAPQLME